MQLAHSRTSQQQAISQHICKNEVKNISIFNCDGTTKNQFSSLVDVRSRPDNILDHFHCLVDCPNNRDPTWSAEKILGSGYGRVLFEKYGILKSLEIEKV